MTVCILCAIVILLEPTKLEVMELCIKASVSRSTAAVVSSKTMSLDFRSTARAKQTNCLWPALFQYERAKKEKITCQCELVYSYVYMYNYKHYACLNFYIILHAELLWSVSWCHKKLYCSLYAIKKLVQMISICTRDIFQLWRETESMRVQAPDRT